MAVISKQQFKDACAHAACNQIIHPWHESCLMGNWLCLKNSLVGSMKFYSFVYMIQLLMRGKKMTKAKEWRKMGEYYVRSVLLGLGVCTTACTFGCLLRLLTGGRTYYYCHAMIPNVLNGAAIYLEPPSRRGLVINLFSSLMIEYWLRMLESAGYISMTKSKQTLMFMTGSAALFYLMRLEGDRKKRTPLFWLFTPERVKGKTESDENPCPHRGPCHQYIIKGFSKLFSVGLIFTLARVILPKIRKPLRAMSSVKGKHFRMALFFGSYIGIYRAVTCFLCRKRGEDSPLYALPAGYLAGLAFLFNPSLGISIASLTGAFKLYSTILYEKQILPSNIPLPEMLFCICQGTLFHARFMQPDQCPKYIHNLMRTVSNGYTDWLYSSLSEALKRQS